MLKERPSLLLSAVFVTIFVIFDRVFMTYLPRMLRGSQGFIIVQELQYIKSLLLAESHGANPIGSTTTAYFGLALYFAIFVPVCVYAVYPLCARFIALLADISKEQLEMEHFLYLALIVPWVGDVLIYASLGEFPFKYPLSVFALLAFFSINKLRSIGGRNPFSKRAHLGRTLLLLVILVLSILKFGAWFTDPTMGYTNSPTGAFYRNVTPFLEGAILTDLGTGGRLLFETSLLEATGDVNVYTFSNSTMPTFLYIQNQSMAKELFLKDHYQYLMLSRGSINNAVVGANYQYYPALGTGYSTPEHYVFLNKVCDGWEAVVYQYNS